jgi:16S rRNA (uracil1498-N3)-methyltransferase
MYQFFAREEDVTREYVTITGQDAHHIREVVRLKEGDEIRVSVRGGESYLCRIAELGENFVQAELLSKAAETELSVPVTLFQAIPKGDRMETVIEKAVELGVKRIVPVEMRYCVVKLRGERAEKKRRKWQALCETAAKQSKRSLVPEVSEILPFEKAREEMLALDLALVPYENENGMTGYREAVQRIENAASIGVMIGPEGGFAPEEIEALREKAALLSLGKRILRTDTAAITALSMVMLTLEQGGE